jgi:hypothetical protein
MRRRAPCTRSPTHAGTSRRPLLTPNGRSFDTNHQTRVAGLAECRDSRGRDGRARPKRPSVHTPTQSRAHDPGQAETPRRSRTLGPDSPDTKSRFHVAVRAVAVECHCDDPRALRARRDRDHDPPSARDLPEIPACDAILGRRIDVSPTRRRIVDLVPTPVSHARPARTGAAREGQAACTDENTSMTKATHGSSLTDRLLTRLPPMALPTHVRKSPIRIDLDLRHRR